MVVAGEGKMFKEDTVYPSVCQIHGMVLKESSDNQSLICMSPDMYRTLYSQYVLGWKIYSHFSRLEQAMMWCFEKDGKEIGETAYSLCKEGFPVWNEELIAIFEKEAENERNRNE